VAYLAACQYADMPPALPGSDPAAMYESLQKLAALPDSTVVYPGHQYSRPSRATLAAVKEINSVFKPASMAAWLQVFGG
jgi:glyoxylase-like metal-dependent hydrolase (beta-lactamase superfamily II)